MEWLAGIIGFLAGLSLSIGFILGFKVQKRVEDTGGFIRKPKELDPIRSESPEAELDRQIEEAREATERWRRQ